MAKPLGNMQRHQKMLHDQKKWIEDHGGDLAGYITRYGGDGQGFKYGEGGRAIYQADMARLQEIEEALK